MTNIEKAGGLGAGGVLAVALFFANGIEARVGDLEKENLTTVKYIVSEIRSSKGDIIQHIDNTTAKHNVDPSAHQQPLLK